MPRVLYISELADLADPRRPIVELERVSVLTVFTELGAECHVHDAVLGLPPDPGGYDGVVLGGSFGSANDEEPWRVALREWLLTVQDAPLLGICGGHQLLARAHGGVVERMPESQMGVYPLELAWVPGFGGRVVQLHGERVAVPPAGAEVWATDDAGIQALRYGPRRWTVQFHPEMEEHIVRTAGENNQVPEAAWAELDVALTSGRAVLRAWLAALDGGAR